MKYPLRVPATLEELIRHLPPELKRKVREALEVIRENPEEGKPLRDDLEGFRAYKVGPFRIIYRVETTVVRLIAIGPRRIIYEKTVWEIRQAKESGD